MARRVPDRILSRVVLDFLRPIPIGPLRVRIDEPTGGKRVMRLRGALEDGKGPLVTATALFVQPAAVDPAPPGPRGEPPPEVGATGPGGGAAPTFPFFRWDVGYHTAMDMRFARGSFGDGPVTVWMRPRVELLEGQDLLPLERVLIAVDSSHGVSWEVDPREMMAINPDLMVAFHRHATGDWIALEAVTASEPSGMGVARSRLWDAQGSLGWSLQTLVLSRS